MKVAVLTSGGDAPGMNAAIRAVVRSCLVEGYRIYGIYDGYKGLIEGNIFEIQRSFVSDIVNRGGTILRTARLDEFKEPSVQEKAANILKEKGITNLVVIGGDGSYRGALGISKFGIKVCCIPGTIDNDVSSTDYTIGYDTALNTIIECIDKLRDTSSSHQRCSIIEVMGRNCGDLALNSGLAAGAELILSSERVMTHEDIISSLLEEKAAGKHHEIVIVSEKLYDLDKLAKEIEETVGMETRPTILGHLQRGGKPTAEDRIRASLMGSKAVDALRSPYQASCIGTVNHEIVIEDLEKAIDTIRRPDISMYSVAERLK